MAARERQGLQRPVQAGTAGPATLALRGGVEGLRDNLKLLRKPRVAADPCAAGEAGADEAVDGGGAAAAAAGDDGSTPPEFVEITARQFDEESREWRERKAAFDQAMREGRAAKGAEPPPQPLNPGQRAFAREHLKLQRAIVAGERRGLSRARVFAQLRADGQLPHQLLQGAGGVGKSVLFAAMRRVMRRLGLGSFVVSAWTGVASVPFGV